MKKAVASAVVGLVFSTATSVAFAVDTFGPFRCITCGLSDPPDTNTENFLRGIELLVTYGGYGGDASVDVGDKITVYNGTHKSRYTKLTQNYDQDSKTPRSPTGGVPTGQRTEPTQVPEPWQVTARFVPVLELWEFTSMGITWRETIVTGWVLQSAYTPVTPPGGNSLPK